MDTHISMIFMVDIINLIHKVNNVDVILDNQIIERFFKESHCALEFLLKCLQKKCNKIKHQNKKCISI